MKQQFIRNIPAISEEEQQMLGQKRAAVIGCGGLGGHIAELLARAGLGKLTVADGDCFEESNLNRQLLALSDNLGLNKAEAAAKRIKAINPEAEVGCFPCFFDKAGAEAILAGADIVMDALDNGETRLLLEEECARRGLTLVHGAIEAWSLQACVCPPGSGILRSIYGEARQSGGKSCMSPAPAACAAIECAEAIKILCGRKSSLENRLLFGDLQSMEFHIIEL